MITWIVGSGGLFGQAIARQADEVFLTAPIPWRKSERAALELFQSTQKFKSFAGDNPWQVLWCAGSATTSTSREVAWRELQILDGLLNGLRRELPRGPGAFFLTSSAGGVFAGSASPPFSESSAPVPISAYGELKLAQEDLVRRSLGGRVPVVIGRVGNLYGPGQNLSKLQGLISRLALSVVKKEPISVFVPLSTLRDYTYVDDAARMSLAWLLYAQTSQRPQPTTAVIASGEPVSVGELIHVVEHVSHSRVPVTLGTHESARAQAADLRLVPTDVPGSKFTISTPLPVGVRNVYMDVLRRFQAGETF